MDLFIEAFKKIFNTDFSLKFPETESTDEERIEEIIEELEKMEVWT